MHLRVTRIILVIPVDVFIIFILIYLIKRGAFLPILVNVTFAALERVTRCIFPRGIQTLSFTPCVHVALTQDDQSSSLLAISTALESFVHAFILSISYAHHCPPVIAFPFPFTDKRKEPTRQPVDSPAERSPFLHLRPRRLPIRNSCWLHKESRGWSLSSQGNTWTSWIDVLARWRKQQR